MLDGFIPAALTGCHSSLTSVQQGPSSVHENTLQTWPVKFRVYLRRRGPTSSPCYATLSGWRLGEGTPFTKSLFLKTSIRLLVSCPEWLYKQRRWTIIRSGSMSITRSRSLSAHTNAGDCPSVTLLWPPSLTRRP